ncbi:MAG: phosphatidate cytidylyltransferase [Alphaproteobacteria bacterium]|nr:phosphatidate cytidylyltransferase [Alphaproteobacteria bacterium]
MLTWATWKKRLVSGLVLGPAAFLIIWGGGYLFAFFVLLCAVICFYEWVQLSLKSRNKFLFIAAGAVYIALSFWCCYLIRERHGVENALAFILMVWASDIGAYGMGKTIGGARMSPTISPNKTWAGFAGAVLFPGLVLIVSVLAYEFYNSGAAFTKPEPIFYPFFMMIGMVIGAVGQAGDLLISAFKRLVQVKDAGQLIPGHGGLLDRVDAMMLAAPVFLGFIKFMDYFVVS